jgi:uncharacterized protein (DUF2164 family)
MRCGRRSARGFRRVSIQLDKEVRAEAIASIERYFAENMDERIGNLGASALLSYFLDEIGPTIYNQAVADVQEKLQQRVLDLDYELRKDEFRYWPTQAKGKKASKG